ncbi:hypothetical protein [Thermoactinomyces sp. DSM 45892]|uniref:hypothetical protein n=1 Tax=Thermoactinomyces sp. DSM 45892 TaxID=1882753 RepID=UPI0008942E5A|nr:hypothetical protein [Thermoactinomyces sp. DSM 45892]SDY87909.1 hypothetical protein SAMN05444416_109149 [Thermoactinomyces sp. DSM 45892]
MVKRIDEIFAEELANQAIKGVNLTESELELVKAYLYDPLTELDIPVDCYVCGGDGWLDYKLPCSACDGSGEIRKD